MLNFCFHDWVEIDEEGSTRKVLNRYLRAEGFEYIRSGSSMFGTWYHADGTKIPQWMHFDSENSYDGLLPNTEKAKVCLKCGKIKRNYNIDKQLEKLKKLVIQSRKENERRIEGKSRIAKAKEIMDGQA